MRRTKRNPMTMQQRHQELLKHVALAHVTPHAWMLEGACHQLCVDPQAVLADLDPDQRVKCVHAVPAKPVSKQALEDVCAAGGREISLQEILTHADPLQEILAHVERLAPGHSWVLHLLCDLAEHDGELHIVTEGIVWKVFQLSETEVGHEFQRVMADSLANLCRYGTPDGPALQSVPVGGGDGWIRALSAAAETRARMKAHLEDLLGPELGSRLCGGDDA